MIIKKIHPYILIIMTFLFVILAGTLLLLMPFASASGKSFGFVNSLFMSTSAVCVTGLSVVNVAYDMSLFGKIVIRVRGNTYENKKQYLTIKRGIESKFLIWNCFFG